MAADIVIRGGTVVDGTGAPGRVADVAIAGGLIQRDRHRPRRRARARRDRAARSTPGFIDIHTHYDAQVFWDPALRPSSFHGVTTVVAGNCGFAIAPTRPEHHDVIVHTLENVEDMDPATLTEGVEWDFETFPEYLDGGTPPRHAPQLHRLRRALGAAPLRDGRRRVRAGRHRRRDRPDGRARARGHRRRRRRVLDELLVRAPGRRRQARPEPLRRAPTRSTALFGAAGDAGKGVILITPGRAVHATPTSTSGSPDSAGRSPIPSSPRPGGRHLEPVGLHDRGLDEGANVWPQVTPRPLTMQFTLADPYNLNTGTVFGELLKVSRPVRLAAYRDPEWRALAAADLEHSQMKPRWETFEVSESARFPELEGRRVTDLAAERGCSPLDVMCDLALAEDLATRFRAYIANDDADEVGRLLTHDHVALGLSDAGAHVDQLCDAPLPTDLLGRWVRDRRVMPLEAAVRKLTGEPADMFGFVGRGYLREGNAADVCVFDPATIGPGPTARVRDFPADAERLTAEEPTRPAPRARERHTDPRRRRAARRPRPPPRGAARARLTALRTGARSSAPRARRSRRTTAGSCRDRARTCPVTSAGSARGSPRCGPTTPASRPRTGR